MGRGGRLVGGRVHVTPPAPGPRSPSPTALSQIRLVVPLTPSTQPPTPAGTPHSKLSVPCPLHSYLQSIRPAHTREAPCTLISLLPEHPLLPTAPRLPIQALEDGGQVSVSWGQGEPDMSPGHEEGDGAPGWAGTGEQWVGAGWGVT